MKLADMNPMTGREFDAGTRCKVGAWSFSDGFTADGIAARYIWHYSTLMVSLERDLLCPSVWYVVPWSLGHGSVSDQNGCNKAVRGAVGGWYYSRKGGAQWVRR